MSVSLCVCIISKEATCAPPCLSACRPCTSSAQVKKTLRRFPKIRAFAILRCRPSKAIFLIECRTGRWLPGHWKLDAESFVGYKNCHPHRVEAAYLEQLRLRSYSAPILGLCIAGSELCSSQSISGRFGSLLNRLWQFDRGSVGWGWPSNDMADETAVERQLLIRSRKRPCKFGPTGSGSESARSQRPEALRNLGRRPGIAQHI
ncbi:hypothetical protein VTI28DRAFT_10331 [Corynascus sepedonium]